MLCKAVFVDYQQFTPPPFQEWADPQNYVPVGNPCKLFCCLHALSIHWDAVLRVVWFNVHTNSDHAASRKSANTALMLCTQFGCRGSAATVVEKPPNDYDVDCGRRNHGDHLDGRPEVDAFKVGFDDAAIARLDGGKQFLRLSRPLQVGLDLVDYILQHVISTKAIS